MSQKESKFVMMYESNDKDYSLFRAFMRYTNKRRLHALVGDYAYSISQNKKVKLILSDPFKQIESFIKAYGMHNLQCATEVR